MQGSASQSQGSGATQTSSVPSYLQNASQQAVQQGQAIATRPWTAYTGEAVAPQTGNQQQAGALAAQQAQAYNAPGGLGEQATQAFNAQNVGNFVNPNTGAVVGALGNRIQQQYAPAEVSLQSNEAGTGNMGSNRAYMNEGALATQKQNALSDMASAEYGNAVNSGTQAFEANRGAAAQQGAEVNGALNATGAAARSTEQQGLNYDYQQFLAQRDWNVNNLQPLLQALGGSRNDVSQSSTGEGIQQQGELGSMIGAVGAVAGALGKAEPGVSNYLNGYTNLDGSLNEVPVTAQYMGGDQGGGALDTVSAGDIESGGFSGGDFGTMAGLDD